MSYTTNSLVCNSIIGAARFFLFARKRLLFCKKDAMIYKNSSPGPYSGFPVRAGYRYLAAAAGVVSPFRCAKRSRETPHMQDSYIGSTSASQAEEAGSTPVSCSI